MAFERLKIRKKHGKITAPEFLNVKKPSFLPFSQAIAKKGQSGRSTALSIFALKDNQGWVEENGRKNKSAGDCCRRKAVLVNFLPLK